MKATIEVDVKDQKQAGKPLNGSIVWFDKNGKIHRQKVKWEFGPKKRRRK